MTHTPTSTAKTHEIAQPQLLHHDESPRMRFTLVRNTTFYLILEGLLYTLTGLIVSVPDGYTPHSSCYRSERSTTMLDSTPLIFT